jgi:parallel beta-helix repeat protein
VKAIKVLSLAILSVLSLYTIGVQPVVSQESTTIYILSDGSVNPSTVPIQRVGDVYTFTSNLIEYSLVVQCNHITIDGAGFIIAGGEESVIDLTCINYVTIRNIQIKDAGYFGIKVVESSAVKITGNTITDSSYGIFFSNTTQSTINGNVLENNIRGIQLNMSSNSNSITSNEIIDNEEGILFFDSTQNTVIYNNVTNNDVGMSFGSASSNMIRSNCFDSNSKQVYDVSMDDSSVANSTNYWNFAYPRGGNYWSDYTGIDVKSGEIQNQTGSDGIGDIPYFIYGYNLDEYPLMTYARPLAVYIVSPQNKTYTVTSVSLTFTVDKPTSWTAYSLDGQANEVITGDKTLTELAVGSHHVTVYAIDEEGLENSATVYFTVAEESEEPQPSQSEPFPITWVAVIIFIVVAVVIVFYYMRIKKKKDYSGVDMQKGHVQLDSDVI